MRAVRNVAPSQAREPPSFFAQYYACLVKNIHVRRRAPINCLLELALPILFMLGLVVLWLAYGHNVGAATQFIDYSSLPPIAKGSWEAALNSTVCSTSGIQGIPPCSGASFAHVCFGTSEDLPVDGFCIDPINALTMVFYLIGNVSAGLVAPLPFDSLVTAQWIAKIYRGSIAKQQYQYTPAAAVVNSGYLYFAPNSSATSGLVGFFNASTNLFRYVYGGTFSDVGTIENEVTSISTINKNWGIIDVNSMTASDFAVQIRLNHTSLPNSGTAVVDTAYVGGSTDYGAMYILSGFITLQNMISEYYLESVVGTGNVPSPFTVPMGYPTYDLQEFLVAGGQLAPLIVVLAFLYPISQLAKRLVLEKELRIREAMHIMGLGNGAFYTSWITLYFLQYFVSAIVIAFILKYTFLTRADWGIMFFCFFFFGTSTVTLAGFVSAFFSKSRIAALLTPLIYFALAMPLFAINSASAGAKSVLLILSPSAFAEGITLLFSNELTGGLGRDRLNYFRDKPTMLAVLIMLAIDTIIYMLLWLYVDKVMPNDWGTPHHPFYCLIDLFHACCGHKRRHELPDGRSPTGVFEDPSADEQGSGGPVTVEIRGLRKEYERGSHKFTAVNNLYWSLREGEITVLLGHNGAGKTTTMNMMTGMVSPDGGDCIVYGKSVRDELEAVRQEIGYCPQHNILWPELTCEEHLWFFASIKGLSGREREDAITRLLKDVDLSEKRESTSENLSGGQKRKLSVAIAFVGGSRLIFLDEPTAGMDVGARRHTWDLLKEKSSKHTILLSTHFMDEADLLGHRVGILHEGRLQCSGSSLFLKSRLGVGYSLVLSLTPHADQRAIAQAIQANLREASLLSATAGEMSFRLPTHCVPQFAALFSVIEQSGVALGVLHFSVSATTLEEVFLGIAMGERRECDVAEAVGARQEGAKLLESSPPAASPFRTPAPPTQVREGVPVNVPNFNRFPPDLASHVWNVRREDTFGSQFAAMIKKRFHNARRDRRTICLQIVTPVLVLLLAMLLLLLKLNTTYSLTLRPSVYGVEVEEELLNCSALFDTATPFDSNVQMDVITDLANAEALSNELLDTANAHGNIERYGSMACNDTALQLALASATRAAIVFYNFSAYHEVAINTFNYYNAIYRKATTSANYMTLVNNAMPLTDLEASVSNDVRSIIIGTIIMIPFTFIPSTFVSWVVKERELKSRHLQNVSGLRFAVYWLSNFIFDLASFLITTVLALIVFAIFNRQEYIGSANIGATIMLFLMYGLAGVSASYLVSFAFDEHSSAQTAVMLGNFIAGFFLVLLVFILKFIESTQGAANVLQYIFRVVPSYCLGEGIINLSLLQLRRSYGTTDTPWLVDWVGWDLVYLAIEFPVFLALTMVWDHPARRQWSLQREHHQRKETRTATEDSGFTNMMAMPQSATIAAEDEDVVREREEVMDPASSNRASDLVVVRHLRKVYPNGKVAIQDLSFGVHPGEVFGFLGTNGAGKTTAIAILCQEISATEGEAFIAGHNIMTDPSKALQCIGYCPQFDALLDLLTAEEHLELFAGIRGIVREDRDTVVDKLLQLCQLTEYRHTLASELSGGNRRKLSVALSLIGGPSVVFFDEPSAGMDPVARRGLWAAVEAVADNCAVVLTTHHLEEVEALAHRVAMMVNGTLRCVGTKSHLKAKYGSGFELNARLRDEDSKEPLLALLRQCCGEDAVQLIEYRSLRATIALPQSVRLSTLFATIEAHKTQLGLTDYSISQTSLEQVFLRISRDAENADAAHDVQ